MTTERPESTEITCPQCSNITEVTAGVDTFCPTCDYPLFWADPAQSAQRRAVQSAEVGDEGAAGDDDHVHSADEDDLDAEATDIICRKCAFRNSGNRTYCMRCGEELPPPEEWYREGETHVEAEDEPSLWRSGAFAGISALVVLAGAFLVLHFVFDQIWPNPTSETKVVVSGAEGITNTAVVMVGSPELPAISYYSDSDSGAGGGTSSSLNLVLCRNNQCVKRGTAFDIDPEGTPGKNGLAMVRVAGGPLVVYRREETGSLVALECGTIDCKDSLGTRRFFPVDEGGLSELEKKLAFAHSSLIAANLAAADVDGNINLSADAQKDPRAIRNLAGRMRVATQKIVSALDLLDSDTTASQEIKDSSRDIRPSVKAAADAADIAVESADKAVKSQADGLAQSVVDSETAEALRLTTTALETLIELNALEDLEKLAPTAFGAGFTPVMAVSGGVPLIVYTNDDHVLHMAFLCDDACLDDDGVINLNLGPKVAPESTLALAVPRAGTPYVASVDADQKLNLDRCLNVTCSTVEPQNSATQKRTASLDPIDLTDLNLMPISLKQNQVSMIINPNTLAPEIAFLRIDDGAKSLELRVLECDDQLCLAPTVSEQITSWVAAEGAEVPIGELVMGRGDKGLPVIAYRINNELFVAIECETCDSGWAKKRVDAGEEGGTNSGRFYPSNWLTLINKTSTGPVGYNLAISITGDTAVITHTDAVGTTLRATHVDLKKLRNDG